MNFENIGMDRLMTQSECVNHVNAALGQSRLLGWIVFGMALLIILLSLYCIMKQKDIINMEKAWDAERAKRKSKK
jgi:hypothetical protein